MNKKTQIKKTAKSKKENEFYSLNEALDLIFKKIFGYEDSVESLLNKAGSEGQMKHLKTFRTIDLLIKNSFFEIQKIDGQKILPSEQICFVTDIKTSDEFRIPKTQLDYTLETGKRFCDQLPQKYAITLIYQAPFKSNEEEIKTKFNKSELNKIKSQIRIKDFGYWLKQDNLKKDHVYLVMLGIEPEYYDFLTYEERLEISRNELLLEEGGSFQLAAVNNFIELFKSINWQNSWDLLIDDLYTKSFIVNQTFAKKCGRFIEYLRSNKLLPNSFDNYLDHKNYEAKYEELFKNQQNLDQEDAALAVLGLEPKYAKQFSQYSDIISNDSERLYSSLGDDEKVFFYKNYQNFLDENFVFIGTHHSITKHVNYKGDLEKFIAELHNKGFFFGENLTKYLRAKKKFPDYDHNFELYKILSFYSQMRYWTLKDLFNLILGKNPLDEKKIIFPLGNYGFNDFSLFESVDKKTYSVLLKSSKFCDIQTIDQFYPKEGEGYKPQDVLEWLITHTLIGMPDLLVELTFKNAKTAKDKRKLTTLRKIITSNKIEAIKVGRPSVIDYPRVWEIFITEILEGEFDKDNSRYEKQAKTAFDKMKEDKQTKICKSGRSNLIQHILAKCEKKTEIGRTSVADKVVAPFEAEFSEGFFR